MVHPLDGHLWKLHRAKQHLESLYQELVAFLQPDCYEIVNEFERERHEGVVREIIRRKVMFTREPPFLHWGTVIGDYIQNLRSALDHVIFAISYSRDPKGFVNDRTTEFPIFDDRDNFNRPHRKNRPAHYEIRGIPPEAKAIVEGLQPYHRGQDFANDPLWIVHEMSNIDKHRNIHLTTWAAHTIAMDITNLLSGVRLHRLYIRPPGIIENGTVLAEVEFSHSGRSSTAVVQMQKEFMFTVSFHEPAAVKGEPLNTALSYIGGYVEGVVETLESFVVR